MTWLPVDCHAHTTMSDGQLSVDELVERARERGVRPSVSDHVSRDVRYAIKSVDAFREYLDTLETRDVLRGAEWCWHDSLWRELPEELTSRLTHRIGSMHAVPIPGRSYIHAFARHSPDGITSADYMLGFAAAVESFAREMPVDIFAHPTLVTIPFRGIPAEELWTEEIETRLVDALFTAGIAFEVSNRYPPHERIVRRAIDRGVRISLGSDGHTAVQVADVARPLAFTRALGIADEDLYDPAVHGSRSVQSSR